MFVQVYWKEILMLCCIISIRDLIIVLGCITRLMDGEHAIKLVSPNNN